MNSSYGFPAGGVASYSNATRPEQWNGSSLTVGLSGGARGVVGGVDVNNLPKGPVKVDISIGVGAKATPLPETPGEAHVVASWTWGESISPRELATKIRGAISIGWDWLTGNDSERCKNK